MTDERIQCRCPIGRTEPGVLERVHVPGCPNRIETAPDREIRTTDRINVAEKR